MTMLSRWRNTLFQTIEEAALLRRSRRVRLNDGVEALAGRIAIEGREVELAIVVDSLLHHRLPIFILRPWHGLGFIPHIDTHGTICFLEHEGIVFDWRQPLAVVRESLVHVQRTLREGVTGANLGDFVDEFEVYWYRLERPVIALSNLELSDHVAEAMIASSPNAQHNRQQGKSEHLLNVK